MAMAEREYARKPIDDVRLGVEAVTQSEADSLLQWACSTRAADGRWYPVTIALTNVPVVVVYNLLSNTNFIADQIEAVTATLPDAQRTELSRAVLNLRALRQLLYQHDTAVVSPSLNVHQPTTREPEHLAARS